MGQATNDPRIDPHDVTATIRQKSLKQETILNGVNVCAANQVQDEATRRAASPLADRVHEGVPVLVAHAEMLVRVIHHVLNDEEVLLEPAIRDNSHFLADTRVDHAQIVSSRTRVTSLNTLAGDTLQIRGVVLAAQVNARSAC